MYFNIYAKNIKNLEFRLLTIISKIDMLELVGGIACNAKAVITLIYFSFF
jgi:hypothetical protein